MVYDQLPSVAPVRMIFYQFAPRIAQPASLVRYRLPGPSWSLVRTCCVRLLDAFSDYSLDFTIYALADSLLSIAIYGHAGVRSTVSDIGSEISFAAALKDVGIRVSSDCMRSSFLLRTWIETSSIVFFHSDFQCTVFCCILTGFCSCICN